MTDFIMHTEHEPALRGLAVNMARIYPMEVEDAMQEVYVQFYSAPFQTALAGREESERGAYTLGMARRVMHNYGKIQKSIASGFSPEDIYSYNGQQVAVLVEQWFEWLTDGNLPQAAEMMRVSGGGDAAAQTGGPQAALADIGRAVWQLHGGQRAFLAAVHARGLEAAAEEWRVDVKSAGQRHRRILRRLCELLNDYRETVEHDGPGARRAMSNERARSLTER